MSYLQSLPRRLVTLYLPLSIIVFILLFPFYWMGLTAIKPDEQLLDLDKFNPFWTWNPTFKHFYKLLFESYYPHWLWNTLCRGLRHHPVDLRQCFRGLCHCAAALSRRALGRRPDLSSYLVALDPVYSARHGRVPVRPVRFADGADPDLSDHPDPFSTWLLMGYFKTIPFELEECALIDGASRGNPDQNRVAAGDTRSDLGLHLLLHAMLERVHLRAHLPAIDPNKTVPVAIVNEFVDGDIYRWGSLMAGALAGSLPLVILYAFFVEHYVSAMTGAVKE